MGARTDLAKFEAVLAYVRGGNDTGNSLYQALDKMLIDLDGAELDEALLTLDLEKLTPFLVIWRKYLIQAIAEYGSGPAFYYIHDKPKEVEPL